MSGRKMMREDLVAMFEAKAASPPIQENELLVRHLKCEESLHLAGALTDATQRYRLDNTQTLQAPAELLAPMG
jgi:hypothetical protein